MKLFRAQSGPAVFIFSADRAELTVDENVQRRRQLLDELEEAAIPYKLVIGEYNGERESSVVLGSNYHDLVLAYLKRYGQDLCLLVDNHQVYKVYPNGHEEYFGVMENVGRHEPAGDYTYDPFTRCYFKVKEAGDA